MNYQVTFRGMIHDSQGLSRSSREYILALDRLGVDIRVEPLNFGTSPVRLISSQVKRLKELMAKPKDKSKKQILVHSLQPNTVDPTHEKNVNGFDKVIISTVWETTRVPDFWIPSLETADAVFVPTKQNVDALKDSGVTIPIYMTPHIADVENYQVGGEKLELVNAQDTFNFISVFQWQHRKAPEVLLEAYWREFTKEDNVSLILKTYYGNLSLKEHQRQVMNNMIEFKKSLGVGDNTAPLYYTGSLFDDEDMAKLYALGDVYAHASRGEGVGVPYLEAMCSGVPCIATGWGGQVDFINEGNGLLVDYTLEFISDKEQPGQIAPQYATLFTTKMKWAEPSVDDMRRKMRYAYEHQEEMKQKGIQARKDMESYAWHPIGTIYKEAIEKVI